MVKRILKVAILDLYAGQPNEGMRCIKEILKDFSNRNNIYLTYDEFEVRESMQIPGLNYDAYISTGGPGSPLTSEGSEWENLYFDWLQKINDYNSNSSNTVKKHVLLICHSFQLACRFFKVCNVTKRKSTAFGVFPIHLVENARNEPVFEGMNDPFYAVDSRDYQVIEPDRKRIEELGASILAIEKERPHVPLERAVMALRFNDYMIGTQFHPEADAIGMSKYLRRSDKKDMVVKNHGLEKWESMIEQLDDPDKIKWTYSHIIPNFLQQAINSK